MEKPRFLHSPDTEEVLFSAVAAFCAVEVVGAVAGVEVGLHAIGSYPARSKIQNLNADIDHAHDIQSGLAELHVPPRLDSQTNQFLSKTIHDKQQQIGVESRSLPNNPSLKDVEHNMLDIGLAAAAFAFVAIRTGPYLPRRRDKAHRA